VSLVKVPAQDGRAWLNFLAQERPIAPLGARLMALSDPSEVHRQARTAAWGGGAGGAVLSLLFLYGLHRRRILRQLLHTRNALQQTHDQLERQVDERTWQLRSANEELQRQIDQRVQAESELMQAGKLAVLGQMSAGISHEINQPLTALRALSRNALQFLEIGRTREVAGNLQSIDEMAERMGRIVNQLKSFARKDGAGHGAVDLAAAVRNVLLMLDHRLRAEPVTLQLEVPEGLRVSVDSTRLEQVLLNLIGNALDAMTGSAQRELRIATLPRADGRVLVQISDSGQGMDEAQMAHLFEPFFTTKAAGQGLGLGLVISSKIVGECGGTLRAQRGDLGMLFEFDLAAAEECHV
jgi:two-component system, NtrC family, C4-dicarboxylate transport sensor histidine kinase DctB